MADADLPAVPARRPKRRAVPLALATVYGPTLAPFALGPLTECDHCIDLYLRYFVITPGMTTAIRALGAGETAVPYLAGALTSLALVGAAWFWGLKRAIGLPLVAIVAVASFLQAMGFSVLLRM